MINELFLDVTEVETYKQALKRQLSSGTYDPKRPSIVPTRDDERNSSREPLSGAGWMTTSTSSLKPNQKVVAVVSMRYRTAYFTGVEAGRASPALSATRRRRSG